MTPEPWEFILGALAIYRATHFLAEDTIIDRPRDWLVERLGDRFDELITCYWCAGTYVTLAAWGAWLIAPGAATFVAAPLAAMAVVGLLGKLPATDPH
jgi:hypothetical protein